MQNYFTKILEDDLKALIKPQYVDQIPKAIRGTVGQLLDRKNECNNMDEIGEMLGKFWMLIYEYFYILWFILILHGATFYEALRKLINTKWSNKLLKKITTYNQKQFKKQKLGSGHSKPVFSQQQIPNAIQTRGQVIWIPRLIDNLKGNNKGLGMLSNNKLPIPSRLVVYENHMQTIN